MWCWENGTPPCSNISHAVRGVHYCYVVVIIVKCVVIIIDIDVDIISVGSEGPPSMRC